LNTKSYHSSNIKVDLVEPGIPKLSYFDPSDAHDINIKQKYANLVFHLDTVVMMNTNDINQLKTIHFIEETCLLKFNMKNSIGVCWHACKFYFEI
jgi:hypothetical protein